MKGTPENNVTVKEARKSGKRGAAAIRSPLCIEGEYVTVREIARRVGKAENTTREIMRKLRSKPGAITWDALKGEGQ